MDQTRKHFHVGLVFCPDLAVMAVYATLHISPIAMSLNGAKNRFRLLVVRRTAILKTQKTIRGHEVLENQQLFCVAVLVPKTFDNTAR